MKSGIELKLCQADEHGREMGHLKCWHTLQLITIFKGFHQLTN